MQSCQGACDQSELRFFSQRDIGGRTVTSTQTPRKVLWIDDDPAQLESAVVMLAGVDRVHLMAVDSSDAARNVLDSAQVDCIVTDIMRRTASGLHLNEGQDFVRQYVRPAWPEMPVIYHTKNLPWTFEVDDHSQYLSKWESLDLKKIELEARIADSIRLYEAFVDHNRWLQIQPRLVAVQSSLLEQLSAYEDIWRLNPNLFEQVVAELLMKQGFEVLWIPGGRDGGIDIVAGCQDSRFLIDVKRYRKRRVGVELVRSIYGVTHAAQLHESGVLRAGIITSSYFTRDALEFRDAPSPRILLRDRDWLSAQLKTFAPNLAEGGSE